MKCRGAVIVWPPENPEACHHEAVELIEDGQGSLQPLCLVCEKLIPIPLFMSLYETVGSLHVWNDRDVN